MNISPSPTDEEAAAIIAALHTVAPRAGLHPIEEERRRSVSWRFSSRWWARPVASRRNRPF